MVTLEQVRNEALGSAYPTWVLEQGLSALVLFAAAFHGRQDAVWIADAGMTATCVDRDKEKLLAMAAAYPDGWRYVTGDVYEFARSTKRRWDVVSADPYSNQFQEMADELPTLCKLARRAVVLGVGVDTEIVVPEGWERTGVVPRSRKYGGVFWLVLEKR